METRAFQVNVRPDHIALLTFDIPGARANTMGREVLADLDRAIKEIESNSNLRGLILRSGKPGTFIVGADLKELGSAEQSPELARKMVQVGLDLIARIEKLPYPTVAAIEGPCMGGGLELALGFDHRIVSTHPKTELGLPEVKIGLFPGWGGTQRLPRVIGPANAVEMITSGEPANAKRSVELGLAFDAVPSERLIDEAVRLLNLSAESGEWKQAREQKQRPVGLSEDQLSFAMAVAKGAILAKTKGQLPAPLAAADVIEKSANKTLADGLKMETDAFVKLVGSPISRNLIAVFFMNQRIQKDTGIADANVKPREINRVGVIGAGIMGSGIAGAFIRKGIPVALLDNAPGALDKGLGAIHKVMASRVAIGRMKPEEVAAALGKLSTTQAMAALGDRDLVIEAVVENEAVKTQLFQELQKHVPADAIVASNTSTISITRMAKAVRNPELFAGMHFFNPVDRMQLVEVIRGEKTNDVTVATLVAQAKRVGKSPIVVKDCPGFLVNRILFPYINESLALLEEGADPRAIDKAATAFGMPMGPIALNDVVGLDTSLYAGHVVNTAFADRAVATSILKELVDVGRLGQKSGAGFYNYAKDPKKGVDDLALAAILAKVRKSTRQIGQEEITDRLFLPMVVEATRCLEEGIVREPADVDMGLILGIGFPPWRGGILRWADGMGAGNVVKSLEKYAHLGKRFEPTGSIRKLAASGGKLYPR